MLMSKALIWIAMFVASWAILIGLVLGAVRLSVVLQPYAVMIGRSYSLLVLVLLIAFALRELLRPPVS